MNISFLSFFCLVLQIQGHLFCWQMLANSVIVVILSIVQTIHNSKDKACNIYELAKCVLLSELLNKTLTGTIFDYWLYKICICVTRTRGDYFFFFWRCKSLKLSNTACLSHIFVFWLWCETSYFCLRVRFFYFSGAGGHWHQLKVAGCLFCTCTGKSNANFLLLLISMTRVRKEKMEAKHLKVKKSTHKLLCKESQRNYTVKRLNPFSSYFYFHTKLKPGGGSKIKAHTEYNSDNSSLDFEDSLLNRITLRNREVSHLYCTFFFIF